jgi:hypothetical protein
MEDRSLRRMRNLATQMAPRGLTANENVCALISMVARSTARSNQRPDTLMQDRKPIDRPASCNARPHHTFGSNLAVRSRCCERPESAHPRRCRGFRRRSPHHLLADPHHRAMQIRVCHIRDLRPGKSLRAYAATSTACQSGTHSSNTPPRCACQEWRYPRLVPLTTISTCRPPQREHTSFSRQSRTLVSAPYRAAISAGSGST